MCKSSRSRIPCAVLALSIATLLTAQSAHAATPTWVGNTDANWATAANWGGTAPVTNDTLFFGAAGSAGATLNNDIAAGTTFTGITFNSGAPAYTIGGNGFKIGSSGLTNSSSNFTQTITATVTSAATLNITGNFTLGNLLWGAGNTITIASGSTVNAAFLNPSFNGAKITVNGTLNLNSGPGSIGLSNGAGSSTIDGTGTITGSTLGTSNTGAGSKVFAMTGTGSASFTNNIAVGASTVGTSPATTIFTVSSGKLSAGGIEFGKYIDVTTTATAGATTTEALGTAVHAHTINVNGGSTLNLGSGGIISASVASATNTVAVNFGAATIGASANWSSSLGSATDAFNKVTLTDTTTGTTFNTTDSVDGTTARTIALSGVLTGTGKLNTTGNGTLILSGANTYTGDTTISAGTLALADNAQLRFAIGATAGTNNKITGTGTLTLDGDFVFDLSAASITPGTTWNIVDVANLNETFSSTFSVASTVASFSPIGTDLWQTTAINGATYQFSETTGNLVVVPEPGAAGALIGGAAMLLGLRRRTRLV